MATKPEHHKLRNICREVCVPYGQVTEVLKRIADRVLNENAKITTESVGTFHCKQLKGRTYSINGETVTKPDRITVGLIGNNFVGTPHEPPRLTALRVSRTDQPTGFSNSVLANLFNTQIFGYVFTSARLLPYAFQREDRPLTGQAMQSATDVPDTFEPGDTFRRLRLRATDLPTNSQGLQNLSLESFNFGDHEIPIDGTWTEIPGTFNEGDTFPFSFPNNDGFVQQRSEIELVFDYFVVSTDESDQP